MSQIQTEGFTTEVKPRTAVVLRRGAPRDLSASLTHHLHALRSGLACTDLLRSGLVMVVAWRTRRRGEEPRRWRRWVLVAELRVGRRRGETKWVRRRREGREEGRRVATEERKYLWLSARVCFLKMRGVLVGKNIHILQWRIQDPGSGGSKFSNEHIDKNIIKKKSFCLY